MMKNSLISFSPPPIESMTKPTKSIMKRFIMYTIILSLICSTVLSVFIAMIKLDDLGSKRNKMAKERLLTISTSAAFAAYNLDSRVTEAILQGFRNDIIFDKIEIKDNFGDVLYSIDNTMVNAIGHYSYPNWITTIATGDNANHIELPLVFKQHHSAKLYDVGLIQAKLNKNDTLNSAFNALISTMGYSIITISFITLIICFMFRQLIDLPLASIIKKINDAELYSSNQEKGHILVDHYESTEFSKLAQAYNKSASRTSNYMDKLHIVTDELRSLSRIDPLTTAWNRRALIAELDEICTHNPHNEWMIIATDLDNFSQINDTYGHEIGDLVLKNFFSKIKSTMPESAFISRTGGDEFIILISRLIIKSTEELFNILTKLTKMLPSHADITHHQYIEASFGISLYPEHAKRPSDLLNTADLALYHSKNNGKRSIELFDSTMLDASEQRIKLHRELDELIENKKFILHYQPKVCLSNGKIIGCEALLRLPDSPNSAPFKLLDSAEKSGRIIPLGSAILERAFSEFTNILDLLPKDFRLSINVSTKQFKADNFIPTLSTLSSQCNFPLNQLDIEITESTQLEYSESIEIKRKWLKDQNCSLTLDDFGTGYASLEYLIKFSFDQIKIDKEFIRDLPNDINSQAINQVVRFLSLQFKMKVVAEGIENIQQDKWLNKLGINYGQGYLYARAEPLEQLIQRIKNQNINE